MNDELIKMPTLCVDRVSGEGQKQAIIVTVLFSGIDGISISQEHNNIVIINL